MTASYAIETWGCQMNEHDAERMAGLLNRRGFSMSPDGAGADAGVVILNTCAVREKAEDKLYSRLGELRLLKKARPDLVIAVAGCIGQMSGADIFKRAPFVDLVLGPRAIKNLPELVEQARRQRTIDVNLHDDSIRFGYDDAERAGPGRARVTVMEGCDKTCAYCIVPTTRGREQYRGFSELLDEVKRLAGRGFVEIELLGQNVNAWHDEARTKDFADLCRAVARVDGIRRVRFTTSHPLHFTERIAAVMGEEPAICPYLHLPVQSGSNAILKAMKRGYTRENYLERLAMARAKVPNLSVSTDFIVAFPGETEADHEATMALAAEARFDFFYSFLYSPRPGTPAENLGEIPRALAKDRHMRLLELQAGIQEERMSRFSGVVSEVLVEGEDARGDRPPEGWLRHFGHDRHWKTVVFDSPRPLAAGTLAGVRIERTTPHQLRGTIVGARRSAAPGTLSLPVVAG